METSVTRPVEVANPPAEAKSEHKSSGNEAESNVNVQKDT